MKKIMVVILALILSLTLITISSACVPKPTFEDIIISSSVEDDTYEPLDIKTEFEASAENIYATIKFSNVKGDDNFRFKWTNLDTGGIVIDYEDQYAKDQKGKYISSVVWTKISSQDFQLKIIPSGDYRVDFYNNGEVVKTTTFKVKELEVTEEVAEATVTFDQGNEYSGTDFGFTLTIPDNWTFEENKTEQEVVLAIVPPSQDIQVLMQFSAVDPELYLPYEDFADNDSASFAEQQGWTFIEKGENDAVLENGTPFKEYYYNYTDNENNSWVINYGFAENSDRLYLIIVITDENNSNIAQDAYVGILNSLIFN